MQLSAKQLALLSDVHKDIGKGMFVAMYAIPILEVENMPVSIFAHLVVTLLSIATSLYYKHREESFV